MCIRDSPYFVTPITGPLFRDPYLGTPISGSLFRDPSLGTLIFGTSALAFRSGWVPWFEGFRICMSCAHDGLDAEHRLQRGPCSWVAVLVNGLLEDCARRVEKLQGENDTGDPSAIFHMRVGH